MCGGWLPTLVPRPWAGVELDRRGLTRLLFLDDSVDNNYFGCAQV